MPESYNQIRALMAISRGSLIAIFRSPSAVVFSFVFPLIFILVFGFIGNGGGSAVYKIAIDEGSDSTNALYDSLIASKRIKMMRYASTIDLEKDLLKGRITGVIKIEKNAEGSSPAYLLKFRSTTASGDKFPQFLSFAENLINKVSNTIFADRPTYALIDMKPGDIQTVREYKTIDFILPGQLGFSLLSAGVFGVAFIFLNLRQTLVLKRFFATPIKRTYIVLGEAISRVLFGLITAVVILLIGHFAFDFTLVHGLLTFIELIILSFLGLVVFLGFGFIVSGLARNESSVPPMANIITLPQFLIGGTFFSTDVFPPWLKAIADTMPLKHLNDAMRNIAFEGAHLNDCIKQIGILGLWGVVVYIIAIKVFRWE